MMNFWIIDYSFTDNRFSSGQNLFDGNWIVNRNFVMRIYGSHSLTCVMLEH